MLGHDPKSCGDRQAGGMKANAVGQRVHYFEKMLTQRRDLRALVDNCLKAF